MNKQKIEELAAKAGVRFFGNWLEGHTEAIYKFAELVVNEACGEDYCLWPDGTYCTLDEVAAMTHMSDDYAVIKVSEWDDEGEPMFPGGLR